MYRTITGTQEISEEKSTRVRYKSVPICGIVSISVRFEDIDYPEKLKRRWIRWFIIELQIITTSEKHMFLHIGGDVVIPEKNIIAILDIESTTVSKDTKEFLKIADEEGFIESISNDIPKSYIITEIDKKSKIFLSPISSVTLQKRSGYVSGLSNL
jgi:extracellular matrix regulatory protein B